MCSLVVGLDLTFLQNGIHILLKIKIQDSTDHKPLYSFVDSPPLWVVGLLFIATSPGLSLLRYSKGAGVDDVATFPCTQRSVDQLLVFLTAASVCAGQRLSCSHHHLRTQTLNTCLIFINYAY